MANAAFKITEGATVSPFADAGFDATAGATVTLELEDPTTDVQALTFTILARSKDAPDLIWPGGAASSYSPDPATAPVEVEIPDDGAHSWLVRCQINGAPGVRLPSGQIDYSASSKSRVIAVRSATTGLRKEVVSERTEYDPTYGSTGAQNEMVDAIEGLGVDGSTPQIESYDDEAELEALPVEAAVAEEDLALTKAGRGLWQFDSSDITTAAAPGRVIVPTNYDGRWKRVTLADSWVSGANNLAELKAITNHYEGMIVFVGSKRFRWTSSVLTGDDVLLVAPNDGLGTWVRDDQAFELTFVVTQATADGAIHYTLPSAFQLLILVPYWHPTVSWSGGTGSSIGLSSSNTGLSTKGDLLGGAGGDVAATLVSTGPYAKGTKGTKIGTPACVITGGETLRHDRIVDDFTIGSGLVCVPVIKLLGP